MTTPTPPSEPNQPVAGWYPDPNGSQLRYWDGQRWTEHVAPYPDGDPGAPAPSQRSGPPSPSAPPPPQFGDAVHLHDPSQAGDRLPAINQWMSETFRLVIDQAGHLFTMLVVLTFAIDLIAAGSTWVAVRDLVLTFNDDDSVSVDGATSWIAVALGVSVLSMAAKIALAACAARHVLAARTGVPESWSDTLREAGVRAPRLIGSIVAFFAAFVVLYLIVVLPLGVIAAVIPVLGLFAFVAVFVGLLAGLARIGFAPLMALIAPVGQGGIGRSIALTNGATRAVIKRLAMLALIGFTMIFIASLFTAPLLGGGSELTMADRVIDFGEVVGDNAAAFGIGQVISGLVAGAFAALVGGGLGLLYADLGGAIEPSITDVDPTGAPPASQP
ncbi:MAG: DUF2510 domain-containing protein [Acidimicrobiales bacterium]